MNSNWFNIFSSDDTNREQLAKYSFCKYKKCKENSFILNCYDYERAFLDASEDYFSNNLVEKKKLEISWDCHKYNRIFLDKSYKYFADKYPVIDCY